MFPSSVASHLKTPLTRADVICTPSSSGSTPGSAPASPFLSVSRTSRACYSLPFLLLPAPQASDSSLSRDLPSTSQPQPGLSGLPLSFLFTDCVTTRGCCSIPRPHLTPPEHKPREGRCDECFIQHSLLTLSPLPGTWGMFNEYSPNG